MSERVVLIAVSIWTTSELEFQRTISSAKSPTSHLLEMISQDDFPPQVLQAASKWRGGVPGQSGRCTSGVSTPGRATQGVKATPFCSANACR
ncbi:hypothetical protein TNCV_2127711 [Trichonephila clavipes]|nr:hypothetical protein TNCV_2127711 [Trichonephila clavipes]